MSGNWSGLLHRYPLWSNARESLVSSTDPNSLDVSIESQENIESLKNNTQKVNKIQLVSTDISDFSPNSIPEATTVVTQTTGWRSWT